MNESGERQPGTPWPTHGWSDSQSSNAASLVTTTTLTVSPASRVRQGDQVTLTATVTPATAAGTLQFRDRDTNLGSRVAVLNGTASGTTSTLTVGSHRLTAVFTPTDPASLSASTSPAVRLTVLFR